MSKIKVGDIFTTKNGGDCIVLDVIDNKQVLVEFCDEYKYQSKVYITNLKKGEVRNKLKPAWFGVGYLGNVDTSKINRERIRIWQGMLSRCYNAGNNRTKSYTRTKVDEKWHNFENFLIWYEEELKYVKWEGKICLDKDLIGDSTLYSDKTCCLIPAKINTILANPRGGKYLPGAEKLPSGRYRGVQGYASRTMLFETEEEAHLAYVEFKIQRIKEYADEYKDKMNPIVYNTLITKDFRSRFIRI